MRLSDGRLGQPLPMRLGTIGSIVDGDITVSNAGSNSIVIDAVISKTCAVTVAGSNSISVDGTVAISIAVTVAGANSISVLCNEIVSMIVSAVGVNTIDIVAALNAIHAACVFADGASHYSAPTDNSGELPGVGAGGEDNIAY